MTVHDALFIQQLQAAFHAEAQEHLQAMSSCLLELEKAAAGPAARPLLEQIFREAHSLKGAARAVAFADIERVCQELENVFAAWKRLDGGAKPEEFDAVSQALDLLGALAAQARQDTASAPAASDSAAIESVLRTLAESQPRRIPAAGRRWPIASARVCPSRRAGRQAAAAAHRASPGARRWPGGNAAAAAGHDDGRAATESRPAQNPPRRAVLRALPPARRLRLLVPPSRYPAAPQPTKRSASRPPNWTRCSGRPRNC